ncbi:hypothetical protein EV356DRAFT_177344 [Viridothelium virens]|uniref:Uncharacterized protein n=1 Tax=Viridothelium virens TaxID=1048519 RepID=A0A6A6H7E3_VIRVR|nr:hypothetical protein EV356DRAFT_177344 [Viridothelium virens]
MDTSASTSPDTQVPPSRKNTTNTTKTTTTTTTPTASSPTPKAQHQTPDPVPSPNPSLSSSPSSSSLLPPSPHPSWSPITAGILTHLHARAAHPASHPCPPRPSPLPRRRLPSVRWTCLARSAEAARAAREKRRVRDRWSLRRTKMGIAGAKEGPMEGGNRTGRWRRKERKGSQG